MKTTVATVLAFAGAALVSAQEIPSNMPECGKICATNMLGKSAEFGCEGQDIACLCKDVRFNNGVHDCAVEACGDINLANIVIAWGNTLCSGAGAGANIPTATGGGSGGGATGTNSEGASPTNGDGSGNGNGDGNDDGNGNGDKATAITTSAWTSVITGDGVTSTATGETTIWGIDGVPIASTTLSATTSPIVSTHTDETTTFETTVGTSTFVPSQSSGAAGGGDGNNGDGNNNGGSGGNGDGNNGDGNNADGDNNNNNNEENSAQALAAPILGFLAAVGVAAALL